MFSRKHKWLLIKLFSLFSVVRGYNILIMVVAQYLASIFILGPNRSLSSVLFDIDLLVLVLASSVTIAAGYIINNFYDSEKDLINRPRKSMLDRLVSQNTKLSLYFVLNFLAVIMASYVSFGAVLFFAIYIFGIWIYSHKIKKWPFVGNVTSAVLTITPFFAIFLYFKNFEIVIFVHAIFLFLIVLMRELVKDLENISGDMASGYQTLPIVYGVKTSKWVLSLFVVFTLIPTYLLVFQFSIGKMDFFFFAITFMLIVFVAYLWFANSRREYLILHNILKFIIVAGVLCIPLIDLNLILEKVSTVIII